MLLDFVVGKFQIFLRIITDLDIAGLDESPVLVGTFEVPLAVHRAVVFAHRFVVLNPHPTPFFELGFPQKPDGSPPFSTGSGDFGLAAVAHLHLSDQVGLGAVLFLFFQPEAFHLLGVVFAQFVALQIGSDGVVSLGILVVADLELFHFGQVVELSFSGRVRDVQPHTVVDGIGAQQGVVVGQAAYLSFGFVVEDGDLHGLGASSGDELQLAAQVTHGDVFGKSFFGSDVFVNVVADDDVDEVARADYQHFRT